MEAKMKQIVEIMYFVALTDDNQRAFYRQTLDAAINEVTEWTRKYTLPQDEVAAIYSDVRKKLHLT